MIFSKLTPAELERGTTDGLEPPRTVAADLGIYPQLIYAWGNSGKIRLHKVGNRIFVDPTEVKHYKDHYEQTTVRTPSFAQPDSLVIGSFVAWDTKRVVGTRVCQVIHMNELMIDFIDIKGNVIPFRTMKVINLLNDGSMVIIPREQALEMVILSYRAQNASLDELANDVDRIWGAI